MSSEAAQVEYSLAEIRLQERIRWSMQVYPEANPRVISNNGPQIIAIRLLAGASRVRRFVFGRESRLKGGCRQDCLPQAWQQCNVSWPGKNSLKQDRRGSATDKLPVPRYWTVTVPTACQPEFRVLLPADA